MARRGKWAHTAALFYELHGVDVDVLYNVVVLHFHFLSQCTESKIAFGVNLYVNKTQASVKLP